jgi:hypothetical protein
MVHIGSNHPALALHLSMPTFAVFSSAAVGDEIIATT